MIIRRRKKKEKDRYWRDRIGWYGLDLSGPGLGPAEGSYKHGN
jgi:hypothetical protein